METSRLLKVRLVPFELRLLKIAHDREALAAHMKLRVPENWPSEGVRKHQIPDQIRALEADPASLEWHGRLIVHGGFGPDSLAGVANLKGPPDKAGRVEVGYEVLPDFRTRGIGTEVLKMLLHWCDQRPEVKAVIARTEPGNAISQKMLEKAGFVSVGWQQHPVIGEVILWERTRT